MKIPFHPIANLFPLIDDGEEFAAIVADMKAVGFRAGEEIVMLDGMILDGRHRYLAAIAAGLFEQDVNPQSRWEFVQFAASGGIDGVFEAHVVEAGPLAFVISKNLNRRHLTASQRAMAAADCEAYRHGGDRKSPDQDANLHLDRSEAATTWHVSERSVADAAKVRDHGAPELQDAVRQGRVAVSSAADFADLPTEVQQDILKNLPRTEDGKLTREVAEALRPAIKEIRAAKQTEKKERRAEREEKLGRRLQALPANHFGVAIEDFEWDHEAWSRETGLDRHPSNHYETADDAHTPEEIVERCRERLESLAADCILFKWTTTPHLAIALKVLELQGFKYVTSLSWNKIRNGNARGPGYWFTGEHELVLVGVRGKVVAPFPAHFRSAFDAPVGEHSEKPDNLHTIVDYHWPNTPKLEFNGRKSRPGWTIWGLDAPDNTITNSPRLEIDAADAAAAAVPDSTHMAAATKHADAHGCTEPSAAAAAELLPAAAATNTPEASGTAREAPGGPSFGGPSLSSVGGEGEAEHSSRLNFQPGEDILDIPDFLRRDGGNVSPIIRVGGPR